MRLTDETNIRVEMDDIDTLKTNTIRFGLIYSTNGYIRGWMTICLNKLRHKPHEPITMRQSKPNRGSVCSFSLKKKKLYKQNGIISFYKTNGK